MPQVQFYVFLKPIGLQCESCELISYNNKEILFFSLGIITRKSEKNKKGLPQSLYNNMMQLVMTVIFAIQPNQN